MLPMQIQRFKIKYMLDQKNAGMEIYFSDTKND